MIDNSYDIYLEILYWERWKLQSMELLVLACHIQVILCANPTDAYDNMNGIEILYYTVQYW